MSERVPRSSWPRSAGRGRRWEQGRAELAAAARNFAHNRHCILTTGRSDLHGIDVAVEGAVAQVTADAELGDTADAIRQSVLDLSSGPS